MTEEDLIKSCLDSYLGPKKWHARYCDWAEERMAAYEQRLDSSPLFKRRGPLGMLYRAWFCVALASLIAFVLTTEGAVFLAQPFYWIWTGKR